jgi:ferredoxin-type protein NapG
MESDKEKTQGKIDRRKFLLNSLVAGGALAVVGAGTFLVETKTAAARVTTDFLRPPGAINENDLIYGCIKCGLCVQICPVQAIKLADISKGNAYGTPYIDPRTQPCDFSCDALQCVETCPTAVLDFTPFRDEGLRAVEEAAKNAGSSQEKVNPFEVQKVAMKEMVRMGRAYVIRTTCLAHNHEGFKGISRGPDFKGIYRPPYSDNPSATPLNERTFDREPCSLCVTECPIGEKAIIQKQNRWGTKLIPKVLDGCTGCGVCVMVCPTEEPSIIVEPF